MAAPTINESPAYEIVASGIAYAKTLTATGTPTSWALTGAPSGITIDNSGNITGTPSVTTAQAFTFSVTATNGDGTSPAVTWLVVVAPNVTGLAANAFQRPIDLDIVTGTLQIPGLGKPLPAARGASPASFAQAGVTFDDETEYLCTWRANERFTLSVGASAFGVLQDVGANRVEVILRETEDATGIVVGELDFTKTGSNTTTRYETTVYLDPDDLDATLSSFEGEAATVAPMLLGVRIEKQGDDRDFSANSSNESLGTFTESSNVADTFAITIDTESTDARDYDVTIEAVFPSDTSLNCTVNRRVRLTYGGGTYTMVSNSGNTTATGSSTVEANWDSTLTNTALTATSNGLNIATTVVASAQKAAGFEIVYDLQNFSITSSDPLELTNISGTEEIAFRYANGNVCATYEFNAGDTAAAIQTNLRLNSDLSQVVVEYDDTLDDIIFRLPADSEVATPIVDVRETTTLTVTGRAARTDADPAAPSYTDAYVRVSVDGVEMLGNSERISSCAVPILIERPVSRTT